LFWIKLEDYLSILNAQRESNAEATIIIIAKIRIPEAKGSKLYLGSILVSVNVPKPNSRVLIVPDIPIILDVLLSKCFL
jgi:hypothetical protein